MTEFFLRAAYEAGADPQQWPVVHFDMDYKNIFVQGPIARMVMVAEDAALEQFGAEIIDSDGQTYDAEAFMEIWETEHA